MTKVLSRLWNSTRSGAKGLLFLCGLLIKAFVRLKTVNRSLPIQLGLSEMPFHRLFASWKLYRQPELDSVRRSQGLFWAFFRRFDCFSSNYLSFLCGLLFWAFFRRFDCFSSNLSQLFVWSSWCRTQLLWYTRCNQCLLLLIVRANLLMVLLLYFFFFGEREKKMRFLFKCTLIMLSENFQSVFAVYLHFLIQF